MSVTVPKRHDAFLSYNSQDRPAVKELAERLRGDGLVLYLDEWELAPGRHFQPELAAALRDSKSCVVFLGRSGLAPWQKQEILVAIDRRTHDEEFHVIPVLLPGTERPRRGDVAHLEFLINASWVEFVETLGDDRAFRRLVWAIKGTRPESPLETPHEESCPYRGLEAFRPQDERFFFGRESLTGWLVSALRREVRAKSQGVRFLGVIGPSGSGKSSVVLAGLVPKLKAGAIEGSQHWPVAVLRPGDEPLTNLAAGMIPSLQGPGASPHIKSVYGLLAALREDKGAQALDIFARSALHDCSEDVRLLVVVDQFEELFTYRPEDGAARERFERDRLAYLANLLNAAAAPGGRVAVLLTMRSDFLGACATFPQLSAVLSAHQELVGPMTPAELREAIVQPAYLVGHEVEPALVERLLGDVKGQTGALPLLQFALTEVWKKRDVRRLTLRAYEELGKDDQGRPRGIEGALEHRADEIYSGLSAADQDLCRRIFLRLVQPGEGTEDTKRRVSFHELLPANPGRAEAVRKLIYVLSEREARLITTEGADATDGWVEVAHEALIQGWTRLRQWVDVDRAGLRTQRRLTDAAQEWAAARPEDKEGYLYSGAPLAVCREWVKSHADELGSVEGEFLSMSEEAVASAERQKRLGYRFRVTAIVMGAFAIMSGGMAMLANKARNAADMAAREATKSKAEAIEDRKKADAASTREAEAARQAKESELMARALMNLADSRRIAYLSTSERDKHLDQSLLLAVEALRKENTIETRSSLFNALLTRPEITSFLHASEGDVGSVAYSPDGQTLAAGYRFPGGGGVVLWDVGRRQRLADAPMAIIEGEVQCVAFSPDSKVVAAGYYGSVIRDGVVAVGGGGVVLWDLGRRQRLGDKPLAVDEGDVTCVAFSPDGKTLAAGCAGGGGVVLWDVGRRERLADERLAVRGGDVSSIAFSPDGKSLAAGYGLFVKPGGGVVIWDVGRRERLTDMPVATAEGEVESVAFSPDGQTLAAACGRGVVMWDVGRRQRLADKPLAIAEGGVGSAAFSPDGKTLAGYCGRSGRYAGGVLLWDVGRRERLTDMPLALTEGRVESVALSPHAQNLAAAYGDGVVMWDVGRHQRLADEPMAVVEGEVECVAFSPDGKILAAGYHGSAIRDGVVVVGGGGVVLWDLGRRQRLGDKPLAVAEGDVTSVTFSPDGKALAAGCAGGGGVVLWDVGRRERLGDAPLAVRDGDSSSVAFSPDGKTLAAGYGLSFNRGGGVVLWDVSRRERLTDMPLAIAEGQVESVAFSPDGQTLAAAYVRGVVLWDVGRRQRQGDKPLAVGEGGVGSAAFSPDGKTLAVGYSQSGRDAGGVVLWDVGRRQRLGGKTPAVAEGGVGSVAFSPDGKTLAAGYANGRSKGGVVLWHAGRRERLVDEPLPIADGGAASVAFSPDGKYLAAGYKVQPGRGSGVLLWDVDLESWQNRAGKVANRNLTRAEWRQYFPDTPYHPTFKHLPVPPED